MDLERNIFLTSVSDEPEKTCDSFIDVNILKSTKTYCKDKNVSVFSKNSCLPESFCNLNFQNVVEDQQNCKKISDEIVKHKETILNCNGNSDFNNENFQIESEICSNGYDQGKCLNSSKHSLFDEDNIDFFYSHNTEKSNPLKFVNHANGYLRTRKKLKSQVEGEQGAAKNSKNDFAKFVLLENFDRTSSNLPTSNLMNNEDSAKNESIINGTAELNAFSDTSVPITENKDFSCANEKNPTSISTCNSGNFQTGLNLLDLVNRFYRRPCTENNTHNKRKESVAKSKSATTQNKSISKSTKNKLKSISKKSSKCQNKKNLKLAKVSQFINKQNLSEYAQSEKCIENCKKESIDMKINSSNSSLHVEKAGESVTKKKSHLKNDGISNYSFKNSTVHSDKLNSIKNKTETEKTAVSESLPKLCDFSTPSKLITGERKITPDQNVNTGDSIFSRDVRNNRLSYLIRNFSLKYNQIIMKTGLDSKPNRTSMKCKTFTESDPNVTCVIENKYISTEKSPVLSTEERLESDLKNTLNCNNNILNKENSFKNVDQKCFNSFRDQFADPVDKDTRKMTDSESCMAIDKCTNLIEDPKSTDILVQPLNDNSFKNVDQKCFNSFRDQFADPVDKDTSKMADSEACMAIDKCTNLIEDPKSTDILVQPLNDNSDLNSLCEDFKTIEELESGYSDHISDIFENIELQCVLQNVQKCNNFANLAVNEFCNFPEVKRLFVYLTTKYNFNSSTILVPKENFILRNETGSLMNCVKDYVNSILSQILSSKATQSRKLFSGSIIKFANRKMSIGEHSVITELFKKREYLELPPVIAKLGNLALLVIFHEYRKEESANFIKNP